MKGISVCLVVVFSLGQPDARAEEHKQTQPPPAMNASTEPLKRDVAKYYRNCTEARAAGVAPLRRGDPGYRAALDRDNDGVACE